VRITATLRSKVVGSNPTPATMKNEGLADVEAANPFRFPPHETRARLARLRGLASEPFGWNHRLRDGSCAGELVKGVLASLPDGARRLRVAARGHSDSSRSSTAFPASTRKSWERSQRSGRSPQGPFLGNGRPGLDKAAAGSSPRSAAPSIDTHTPVADGRATPRRRTRRIPEGGLPAPGGRQCAYEQWPAG